jgi:predicted RNA polymerase sigma factor
VVHDKKDNALQVRGDLLARLSRYDEADRAYADAVATLDEALSHAPNYIQADNNKGNALACPR